MKTDSIIKRYSVTLFVNLFQLLAGVMNSTIVPNALGPVFYGNYQFLFSTTSAIRGGLNLGATASFFTYSSRNVKSGNAFFLFFLWTICQLTIVVTLICSAVIFKFIHIIFPDQTVFYIFALTLLEWLNYISTMLIQFGETKAESVSVQKVNFISNLIKLSLTFILFKIGMLNLNSFIVINYIGSVIILVLIILYFFEKERRSRYFERIDTEQFRKVLHYFIIYGSPLIVYEVFGYISSYLDRWLLQTVSGSMQQAFFSIGFSWSTVAMLFSTSVIHIFWREISFAHESKDLNRVKQIYSKSSQTLFLLTAFISLILAFQAENIVKLFLHKEYNGAINVLRIMSLCPILDTLGQLNAAFMYATEQVKLYRNIAIVGFILSSGLLYVLVAPGNYLIPGLGLQATGVAIKFVLHSFILMVMQTYVVTKYLQLNLKDIFLRQMSTLIILIAVNTGAYQLSKYLATERISIFLFFCIIDVIVIFIIGWNKPTLVGMMPEEITNVKKWLTDKITLIGK